MYSVLETAKLNNLRLYYYFKYTLTELLTLCNEQGNIDSTKLDVLMPWSDKFLDECRRHAAKSVLSTLSILQYEKTYESMCKFSVKFLTNELQKLA